MSLFSQRVALALLIPGEGWLANEDPSSPRANVCGEAETFPPVGNMGAFRLRPSPLGDVGVGRRLIQQTCCGHVPFIWICGYWRDIHLQLP
jgi:hypothetical protein